MDSGYIIFFGSVISGFFALLSAITDDKYKRIVATLIFFGACLSTFGGLKSMRETVVFNERMLYTVTGGDSFVYATLAKGGKFADEPRIIFMQHGEYTVYDVRVSRLDLEEYSKAGETLDGALSATNFIDFGNFTKGSLFFNPKWKISPNENFYHYVFYFSSRNGNWTQKLFISKVNGDWVEALRVENDATGKIMLEKIEQGFPLNPEGLIDWSKECARHD